MPQNGQAMRRLELEGARGRYLPHWHWLLQQIPAHCLHWHCMLMVGILDPSQKRKKHIKNENYTLDPTLVCCVVVHCSADWGRATAVVMKLFS